jgi:hypothetical protein
MAISISGAEELMHESLTKEAIWVRLECRISMA